MQGNNNISPDEEDEEWNFVNLLKIGFLLMERLDVIPIMFLSHIFYYSPKRLSFVKKLIFPKASNER